MIQLVKPLKRHQEQLKLTARIDELDTLQMAGSGSPRTKRRSSFGKQSNQTKLIADFRYKESSSSYFTS